MSAATPESAEKAEAERDRLRAASASEGPAAPELDEASERLVGGILQRLEEAGRHLLALASLRADEARMRLRRAQWRIVQTLLAALVGAALALAGAVYLARGLAGTLAALSGDRPWLGELAAGLVLLALVTAVLAWVIGRSERKELERLKRKYGHDERKGPRSEPENGRGVPGAGAGAGAGGAEAEPRGPRP